MHLIWLLVVGLVAGWLAGKLMRGAGYGVLADILLGIVGAYVGGFLFAQVGVFAAGTLGTIVVATIGAMVLVMMARLLRSA